MIKSKDGKVTISGLICKTYFHPYLIRCGTYYLQTSGVEVTYS